MIVMIILNQNKTIWLIFKIKNKKIKNPELVNCTFIIHKNKNKSRKEPILNHILHLLCSILIFVRCILKSDQRGGGRGEKGEPS